MPSSCPSSADLRPADEATPSDEVQRRFESFLRFAERQLLPVQDRAVVRAAAERDIPVIRIAGRLVQLGHGRFQQRLSATQTTRTNVVANKLAANKDYSRRVLRAVGLPVPAYERVHRQRDAVAAARRIGFPVVVKPNNGNMGLGVTVGVKTAAETCAAYKRTRKVGRSVIVEQFIAGADYRVLVIDGKLQAAAKRIPAHVVGDGVSTIEELVHQANSDPRRGAGERSSWTRIEFDKQADRLLADLGYTRDAVARHGEIVYLRRNANTSAGVFLVGGKDGRNTDRILLDRFVQISGGSAARLLVITTACSDPQRHRKEDAAAFRKSGAGDVAIFHPERRADAPDSKLLAALERVDGVYFSGGGQLKLVATIGGTRFHERLRERYRGGLHVGGTSAGASALSAVMIAGGRGKRGITWSSVELSSGLGLLPGVAVDQHFRQRNRLARLLAAVLQEPMMLGFGVDEATAAEIAPSGRVTIHGAGVLIVVDPNDLVRAPLNSSSSPEVAPTFTGMRLHALGEGWCYDITTRTVLTTAEGAAVTTAEAATRPTDCRQGRRKL